MIKIKIYFGPKSGFNKILEDIEYHTILELATRSDIKKNSIKLYREEEELNTEQEKEEFTNIVAFSDNYSNLTEHTVQGFLSFLSKYDIENLYLQNPPQTIVNQISQTNNEIDIIQYKYKEMNAEFLKGINKKFSEEIIGQDRVKNQLLTALYPLCTSESKKPIVIMLYGPAGVGKTETAKFLSKIVKQNIFRKQFSMLHSEEFFSYMFGGSHSQNSFAKELLERESNIILLDEFDKPHPVFHSAFYQLFDEGIFEDKNYKVHVERSIIICTSNYNSEQDIRNKLGDPIYSRFDSIIEFSKLSNSAVEQLIRKEYTRQFDTKRDWEKNIIEESKVLDRLLTAVKYLKNAREIKKITNEAISAVLIKKILEEYE
jgi:ATP-dependent Clp protease ATP-binding subunit ClpA